MYYPTCYFDGGMSAFVGGEERVFFYEDTVEVIRGNPVMNLDFNVSMEWLGSAQIRINVDITNNDYENYPPDTPPAPTGAVLGVINGTYEFTCTGTDPNRQQVYYKWDWGDGEVSDWEGPFASGDPVAASHTWAANGSYEVKAKVRDPFGEETEWSTGTAVTVACCAGRVGDANGSLDDEPTIGDVSVMIDALFIGGDWSVLPCLNEADINISGGIDPQQADITIGDVSYLIDYLFISGSSIGLPDCQ